METDAPNREGYGLCGEKQGMTFASCRAARSRILVPDNLATKRGNSFPLLKPTRVPTDGLVGYAGELCYIPVARRWATDDDKESSSVVGTFSYDDDRDTKRSVIQLWRLDSDKLGRANSPTS